MDEITPPTLFSQLEIWRQASVAGTISLEEMREAIKTLRGARLAAAEANASSKKKTPSTPGSGRGRPKTPINTDDLLKDL